MEHKARVSFSEDKSSLDVLIQKAIGQSYVSKTLKAISILREVSKVLRIDDEDSKLSLKIDQAINLLGNEEDDELTRNNESLQSEEFDDTFTFLKTFSNTYSRDLKRTDFRNVAKKFTVRKNSKIKFEVQDIEPMKKEKRSISFKRFDSVIKIKDKLSTCDHFNFNLFELEALVKDKTLEVLAHYIFEKLDYFELGYFVETTFKAFTQEIASGYLKIPFHNSMHACDVFQTTYILLVSTQLYEVNL